MKKFILSFGLIIVFIAYALYQRMGGASSVYLATSQALPTQIVTTETPSPVVNSTPKKSSVPKPKVATPPTDNQQAAQTPTSVASNVPTSNPAPEPVQTPVSTPVSTPIPTPTAKFKDGTYTGQIADAYYGNLQISVVISGGQLTNVNILQYPSDRGTSIRINSQALPILTSEAVQSQSANVDAVSGATDTSQAFVQTLNSALSQALI